MWLLLMEYFNYIIYILYYIIYLFFTNTFTAGVLVLCIIFLFKIFQNFIYVLRELCRVKSSAIYEIKNIKQCHIACMCIKWDCEDFSALGFDCEWNVVNGKQRPVALLQLATARGLCCLFRLNILGHIPLDLQDILSNPNILKLGIDPLGDSKHLWEHYEAQVHGTLDLRNLYQINKSLATLAADEAGIKLNKELWLRCSNWEKPELTFLQKEYAAKDAYAAVEIFKRWLLKKNNTYTLWETKPEQYKLLYETFKPEILRYIDIRFSPKAASNSFVQSNKRAITIPEGLNISRNNNVIRKSPLYDNCFMHAPDGELLCSCDKRKAQWYVSKGLAEVISGEPYSIRLLFEPAARADETNGGRFYQQLKQNHCVVCGAADSYLRHNVVPKEYRKYFPNIMKSHQSHDVVLMCLKCHQYASQHNQVLRQKLAIKCQAPTHTLKQVQNAKVLLQTKLMKPLITAEERKPYLRNKIKKYMQIKEIAADILQEAANLESKIASKTCESHGFKVVNYFIKEGGGLTELEVLWRTHFLDTMKPRFLPALWSVTHNHKRVHASLQQKNGSSKIFLSNNTCDY